MRKLTIVCLIAALTISTNSLFAAEEKHFITTSADLKQDYDVITIYMDYEDVAPTFSGDPFQKPTMNAFQRVIKSAKDAGADALIGIRIEPQNFTEGRPGKVLVYGTGVKFKSIGTVQKK